MECTVNLRCERLIPKLVRRMCIITVINFRKRLKDPCAIARGEERYITVVYRGIHAR